MDDLDYAPRRFSCKRNVWYMAGTVVACYQWRRERMNAHGAGTGGVADACEA